MVSERILVILGATGVGKTDWLLSRFKDRGYVVVNVDSIQVYKYFNIGSAKISMEDRIFLPHVMVDEKDPFDVLSVGGYVDLALSYIKEIENERKRVIITGGTPYYLKHLLWGVPSVPAIDLKIRLKVGNWMAKVGGEYAHRLLQEMDPTISSYFPASDIYRTSRAWEVYFQTGKLLSSFTDLIGGLRRDFVLIGLNRPRFIMWERSKKRVDRMLSQGLEEEIDSLLARGYGQAKAMQSIGYKEWIEGRREGLTKEGITEKIYFHTRKYIKRQMTFFRSFPEVRWFDLEHPQLLDSYLDSLML